jgi:Cu(I)/Ag(I) efflux system membrane fusion protein
LITGKRAVVYVKVSGKEGTFEGREVVLGPRAGSYYLVKEGLSEGEMVVVNGNFKIDSAIQILAKPSMMNPEEGVSSTGHENHGKAPVKSSDKTTLDEPETFAVPAPFLVQVDGLVSEYFNIQQALSHDNYKEAITFADAFMKKLDRVDMGLLKDKAHMAWMEHLALLKKSVNAIAAAKDIKTARDFFDDLSDSLYEVTKQFGLSTTQPVYRFFCPMANDNKGAYWLQNKTGTENPYFGSKMFKCGSQVEIVSPGRVEAQPEGTTHE